MEANSACLDPFCALPHPHVMHNDSTTGIAGTPVYTDTSAYNANDLPVTLTLDSGSPQSQVQEIAGYDANSRLTSWHDPGPGQNVTYAYGYDAANRVTSFTAVSGTDFITHDRPQ